MSQERNQTGFEKVHLEPGNQTFSGVMANDKKYIIPRFQRDYSWEEGHWEELWQDVEHMRKDRKQHFMGYLVFQEQKGKTLQIIDGQQRLTTLSIVILAAIGKLKKLIADEIEPDANEKRIKIYRDTYVGVFDPVTLTVKPKLALNRNNDGHFRTIAKASAVTTQRNVTVINRRLNKALRFFQSKFESCKSGEEVAAILADVADGLLFTTITVQNDLNAYMVFETLNARGLHLSTPDLLKNYLLSTMATDEAYSEEHFVDFEEQWAGILEQLGETEFTNFLRSYRGMRKKLVSKKDLFRHLKTDVDQPDQVTPYLEDLKKYAAVYAALQNPKDDFWEEPDGEYKEAGRHLEALDLFHIKTPLSLMMAGYEKLSPADFLGLLRYIVIVTIRYNVICGKSPNNQEILYNRMANELMHSEVALRDLIAMLEPAYPGDKEFENAFTSKTMPSRQSNKKILFLLRKIERHLSGGDEPPRTLTLEHVLPFSPADAWQEYFGRETYENATDRLGNMALLASRENMGQESFTKKKGVLKNSPYKINQCIAEYAEWNMDNLDCHQKWLSKHAKAIWRIPQLEQ